jgi:ubiquinone/menaquinone biosynthesis C-methylase UbiE
VSYTPVVSVISREGARVHPREFSVTSEVSANLLAADEARVREVYARRRASRESEPAYLLCVEERERKLLALLAQQGITSLENTRILEVGCGTGTWLRCFLRWGARPENVTGIDLLAERIAAARRSCPPGITLECGNAAHLAAGDGSFDLVLQSTVFTSILESRVKQQVAREMLRVLRPSGLILWYDFHVNNPWNPQVRGVKRGEIAALFPKCAISLHRLTLAPPLGRPVARVSPFLYWVLSGVKPLCTHYLGTITCT